MIRNGPTTHKGELSSYWCSRGQQIGIPTKPLPCWTAAPIRLTSAKLLSATITTTTTSTQRAMTTVSLELHGAAPGITMSGTPQGLRSWVVAGTALASGLIYLFRKRCSDGIRRRVIRRLDIIAPRKRIDDEMLNSGLLFNTNCKFFRLKHQQQLSSSLSKTFLWSQSYNRKRSKLLKRKAKRK